MGHDLQRAVMTEWQHLPGNAFKVLLRMAGRALDTANGRGQPPHLYFDSIEFLAGALGSVADVEARRTTYERRVYDALARLEREGAVERLQQKAGNGRSQTYRLTLGAACEKPAPNSCGKPAPISMRETRTGACGKPAPLGVHEEERAGKESRNRDHRPAEPQDARDTERQLSIDDQCERHPTSRRTFDGDCLDCDREQRVFDAANEWEGHA